MTSRCITRIRLAAVVLAIASGAAALAAGKWEFKPSAAERRALAAITPASLQAHLSFLSADPLEGRGAGTTGLDVAAEYIAAHFRLAGLKPVGDEGYFQITPRIRLTPTSDGYQCRVSVEGRVLDVPSRQFALLTAAGGNAAAIRAIGIDDAPVVKVPFGGQFPEQMAAAGRSAVITELPAVPTDQAERTAFLDRRREFLTRLTAFKPALVVEVRRDPGRAIDYFASRQLGSEQMRDLREMLADCLGRVIAVRSAEGEDLPPAGVGLVDEEKTKELRQKG